MNRFSSHARDRKKKEDVTVEENTLLEVTRRRLNALKVQLTLIEIRRQQREEQHGN